MYNADFEGVQEEMTAEDGEILERLLSSLSLSINLIHIYHIYSTSSSDDPHRIVCIQTALSYRNFS